MDNQENKKDILEKIHSIRAAANSTAKKTINVTEKKKLGETPCAKNMRAICNKEIAADQVACCDCGKKSLKLYPQGNNANPWAKIICEDCGFEATCGYAEPPNPALKPNTNQGIKPKVVK